MKNNKNFIIRKAHESDLGQMIELWKQLIEFHQGIDAFFTMVEGAENLWSHYVKDNIDKESSLVLVAEVGKQIVGYCLVMIEENPPVFTVKRYGWIGEMAVNKACRREGIGQKLFDEIKKWFKDKDINRIEVRMSVFNESGTNFWRKMGFTPFLKRLCMNMD